MLDGPTRLASLRRASAIALAMTTGCCASPPVTAQSYRADFLVATDAAASLKPDRPQTTSELIDLVRHTAPQAADISFRNGAIQVTATPQTQTAVAELMSDLNGEVDIAMQWLLLRPDQVRAAGITATVDPVPVTHDQSETLRQADEEGHGGIVGGHGGPRLTTFNRQVARLSVRRPDAPQPADFVWDETARATLTADRQHFDLALNVIWQWPGKDPSMQHGIQFSRTIRTRSDGEPVLLGPMNTELRSTSSNAPADMNTDGRQPFLLISTRRLPLPQ